MFKTTTKYLVVNNLCKQFMSYPQINNKWKSIIRLNISEFKIVHIFTLLILVINLYI